MTQSLSTLNRTTTCFYCGMPGLILPLRQHYMVYGPLESPPLDIHMHQCGSKMAMQPQTGEIWEARSVRSPACKAIEALQRELAEYKQAAWDTTVPLVSKGRGCL